MFRRARFRISGQGRQRPDARRQSTARKNRYRVVASVEGVVCVLNPLLAMIANRLQHRSSQRPGSASCDRLERVCKSIPTVAWTFRNRRAKFYRISKAGRKQLAAETRNWTRISELIGRLLLRRGSQ
jgi:hypothetical protein